MVLVVIVCCDLFGRKINFTNSKTLVSRPTETRVTRPPPPSIRKKEKKRKQKKQEKLEKNVKSEKYQTFFFSKKIKKHPQQNLKKSAIRK